MQKWEYLVTRDLSEAELNHLGSQGWELVTTMTGSSGQTTHLILKRPTEEK